MKKFVVRGRYSKLSRGRHSARLGQGDGVVWAGRNIDGDLVVDCPGLWRLHTSDGFRRSARASLFIKPDGKFVISGDASCFTIEEADQITGVTD